MVRKHHAAAAVTGRAFCEEAVASLAAGSFERDSASGGFPLNESTADLHRKPETRGQLFDECSIARRGSAPQAVIEVTHYEAVVA